MVCKKIPTEALIELHQHLKLLPAKSPERKQLIASKAELYGISQASVYRALQDYARPKRTHRIDYGQPKVISKDEMERYCEIIAALKIRTSNKKGRQLSTGECIRLLEEHGVTAKGVFVQVPPHLLTIATINRYLKAWGYTTRQLRREPVAVRFQACYSNECWHFDLSDSDLKEVSNPIAIDLEKGHPKLKLYSVVDDRSGVAYQEYHCVYGEDVEAALKFLFNAMSPKPQQDFPFQGIPKMIYTDNGPIAKSDVFNQVMRYLEINVEKHLPRGQDGRRTTARAKGKVERPFRTVKEMYETLFHLYTPKDELEANQGLLAFLMRYNAMPHRAEPHSRIEDWLTNFPVEGIRAMCKWDRFCTFARQPEVRKVGSDARITVEGIAYEVAPELAGEKVTLWWGLFDNQLYVEYQEKRYGPYTPVGDPIPLHQYRSFKKTKQEERADYIEELAQQLSVARDAVIPNTIGRPGAPVAVITTQPFVTPDPFQELTFPNVIEAKKAIANYWGRPLAKLNPQQLTQIEEILSATMNKVAVLERVRQLLPIS